MNQSHVLVNEGGIPYPASNLDPQSEGGLRFESFVNWMRTAARQDFRKLFGRLRVSYSFASLTEIASNNLGFKKGDEITLRIIPNFLVSDFGGQKELILSTYSPRHLNDRRIGRNFFLVGVVYLFVATFVALKLKMKPRVLGEVGADTQKYT